MEKKEKMDEVREYRKRRRRRMVERVHKPMESLTGESAGSPRRKSAERER